MKFNATDIGVDSGCIIVCDLDYLKRLKQGYCNKELKRLGKTFTVPNGKYKISYRIPNFSQSEYGDDLDDNFDDICSGENETLEIKSGKLVVIDPCYIIGKDKNGEYIDDNWQDWLNDTDFGHEIPDGKGFIIDSMGGDGCYEVELVLSSKII
jgi:hypothetical protein